MKMPIWALAAVLLALLAPFGASLPMGPSVNASSLEFHGFMTESPSPTKVVRRADPTQTPAMPTSMNDPVWPFDPPVGSRPADPPTGVTVQFTGAVPAGKQAAQAQTYTQEEIYMAFRWAASILYSTHMGFINLAEWQRTYDGESFPREYPSTTTTYLPRIFIGLGSWTALAGRGALIGNTPIWEYPIVPGGIWPLAMPPDPPDPTAFCSS
ncbi:hypothetical protein PG984_005635 [Apiospora sp. TS-2023a]